MVFEFSITAGSRLYPMRTSQYFPIFNTMITPSFKSKTSLVLAAGFALSVLPSLAGLVPAFVEGDIFVGFRATSDPGSSESYLVKLGNDSTSFNSSGALILGNLGNDLSNENHYGAGWSSRTDISWGIFGLRNSTTDPILYVSRPRTSSATPANPWPTLTLSKRQATANQVNSVIQSGTGGVGSSPSYIQLSATTNSTVAGFQPNGIGSSSYKWQVTSNSATDFGSTSSWTNIEGASASGVTATVLDVFKIQRVSGVETVSLFGTFTISGSGVITFTKPTVAPVDKDKDGYYDFEEALAGTSDDDPSDFFKVSSITNSAGSTVLSFPSIASRIYKIYYSQDLSAGSWVLIDSVSSGPYTDTDPVRTARGKGFYRVAVTTP